MYVGTMTHAWPLRVQEIALGDVDLAMVNPMLASATRATRMQIALERSAA